MKHLLSFAKPSNLLAVVCVLVALVVPAAAAEPQYVLADVRIEGKQLHAFNDAGQEVTIALGEFRLSVGGRVITGRDAVLWIGTQQVGRAVRHDITVYVEGAAADTGPARPPRTGETLIATVHSEGRISAGGSFVDRPLLDFPLYERAKQALVEFAAAPAEPAAPPPAEMPAEAPLPAEPAAARSTTPAAPPPAPQPPTDGTAVTPAEAPAEEVPAEEALPQPVSFAADTFTYEVFRAEEVADGEPRSVLILRGNVYLAQGDPDSDLYLELRSDAAVLFLRPEDQPADAATDEAGEADASPGTPFGEMPAVGPQNERITGAYLEGDVVIARGERFFRGPTAFYDFLTDRGVMLDPVFRTVQEQREIPVYVRAREARILSSREIWFADAKVTTSEFFTPSYHLGARTAYLKDTTPRDADGRALGEQAWSSELRDVTFNIRGVPVAYTPIAGGDLQQGDTALRKATVGKGGDFGWGVETEWHLFRLLGLIEPEGFGGTASLEAHERGVIGGIDLDYARKDFTGYHMLYGVIDNDGEDDFGRERKDIASPRERGRVLMRHKQFLPNDWQLQFELSYLCDRNFLEEFFPGEYYAGKEQETLLYAKKQTDNWAFTSLVKGQLNRFEPLQPVRMQGDWPKIPFTAESYPDLGLYLVGEPLAGDRLTLFHESHAGVKQASFSNSLLDEYDRPVGLDELEGFDSGHYVRLDTRDEINLPLHAGPINIVPYGVGRLTHWGESVDVDNFDPEDPNGGDLCRIYGQVGTRVNTHLWRVYNNVDSRLWDVHRLKHIITPEVVTFLASSHGVYPQELYVADSDIEGIERTSGAAFNLHQRLQTKRGPAGDRRTVDWMRLDLSLGAYDNNRDDVKSDGRFFFHRPENSLDRNHLNGDYAWHISDSTTLLADMNYDMDDRQFARGNIGLAVQRNPRLRYYAGMRYVDDVDSAVGTFGADYQINRKYKISAFQQYDFAFRNGTNMSSSVTITRKFPRWYGAFTFSYDNIDRELTLLITFWPEGIEEVRVGAGKLSLLGQSDKN